MTVPSTLANGRYQVRKIIGEGDYSAVCWVADHKSRKERALKIMTREAAADELLKRRFLNEAATMARLDHANILKVYDVGSEGDQPFFTMQLARAGNLLDQMKATKKALTPRHALCVAFPVLKGLAHAHDQGIVHRDVKPGNILMTARGVVKLSDFGVARDQAAALSSHRMTAVGDVLGTQLYSAPEQLDNPRDAGKPADVYAVGATIFLLVTGKQPMDISILDVKPKAALKRLPEVLHPLISKACARNPEERYQDAGEMGAAIADLYRTLPEDEADAPVIDDPSTLARKTTIIHAKR